MSKKRFNNTPFNDIISSDKVKSIKSQLFPDRLINGFGALEIFVIPI